MKKLLRFTVLTAVVFIGGVSVFAAPAKKKAAEEKPAAVKVVKDVIYVTRPEMELKGNLYRPEGKALVPGIVLAHGGGFVAGDKDHYNMPEIATFISSKGYAIFSINYRLLQQGGLFPANAQDVKCAVQWLRANAKKNGIDPDRIGIMGNSAGGYMASFVAVTQHNSEFNASCGNAELDKYEPTVGLAVEWYGVHDLAGLSGSLAMTMERVYFKGVKDKAAFKKKYSPMTYAKDAPPTFMIHGDADPLVPIKQSRDMCAAIKAAGRECALVEFPNTGHGFIDEKFKTEGSVKALNLTVEWLDRHFKAKKGK